MYLTFSVITKAHLGLAETNGIFALTDSIELFELGLVDTLSEAFSKDIAMTFYCANKDT